MKALQVLGVILAAVRHFISQAVVDAIKKAAIEAATHGEWSHGAKQAFVIDAGRAVVAASSNPFDDLLYEVAVSLYLKKFAAKLAEAEKADASVAVAPA